MVTAQEVQSAIFGKGLRGYNVEQVDEFLDRVAEQLTADEQRISEMSKDNEELKDKLLELAQKLEGYRSDENALKSALLNAQRMGENVIKEARQKGDVLEREARIRSEDILRAGAEKIKEQELELERIKAEVAQFKANVLGLYKTHIELLSTLPGEEMEPEEVEVQEEAVEPIPEETEVSEENISTADIDAEAEVPAQKDDFWQKDEEELTAEIAASMSDKSETFRGITFSD